MEIILHGTNSDALKIGTSPDRLAHAIADERNARIEADKLKADKTYVDGELKNKADYDYVDTEFASKADVTDIPTKVSELKNDSEYITESKAFDKLCPRGSASASGASLTLADCCGGTNIRNYVIHGKTGGVGDLNAETGKYDIPVTVHGKNLLARTDKTVSSGVTINAGADKWVMSGTSTASVIMNPISSQSVTLKPGTYTLSRKYISGSYSGSASSWIGLKSMDGEWLAGSSAVSVSNSNYTTDRQATFSLFSKTVCCWAFVGSGTFSDFTFSMQLEKGSSATGFEPYAAPKTYTISLDAPLGQGESVTRETGGDIALTDSTTNIIEVGTVAAPEKIEVEYYKDINKVLENLNNAILSQGGNV